MMVMNLQLRTGDPCADAAGTFCILDVSLAAKHLRTQEQQSRELLPSLGVLLRRHYSYAAMMPQVPPIMKQHMRAVK
jgi:hypothetical protein